MNFSLLTLMMFASTSCVESFMVRPSSQTMRSTSLSSSSSTTLPPPNTTDLDTINRAQICLKNPDMFRIDEIREMYQNLEHQNYLCTEECTQTNPECDIERKAERDYLLTQLGDIISSGSSSRKKKGMDMERISACVQNPQDFEIKEIMTMLQVMEALDYECTEEGNQTNAVCDVERKAERDYAMEQLTKYVVSLTRSDIMEKIRSCIENPGHCNIETMTVMLKDLENVVIMQDDDDDVSLLQEEQEDLKRKLMNQITNSKVYMDQIKKLADQPEAFTIEDVMNTMLQDSVMNTLIKDKLNSKNKIYKKNEQTDEYLVQI